MNMNPMDKQPLLGGPDKLVNVNPNAIPTGAVTGAATNVPGASQAGGYAQQAGSGAVGAGTQGAKYAQQGTELTTTTAVGGAQAGAGAVKTGAQAGSQAAQTGAGYAQNADYSKISNLADAKAAFEGAFNDYLKLDLQAFMEVAPIDYYGPTDKVLLWFFLLVPGFFTFYSLRMYHDAIYTMFGLAIFIFGLQTYIHFKLVDEKIWYFIALKNFDHDIQDKVKAAVVAGLSFGGVLAAGLIAYFHFVKFGPTAIVLPIPAIENNYWYFLYWFVFSILFIVLIPVTEALFFFVFQANIWLKNKHQAMIAVFYTLYHFGWIVECVSNWWAIGALTGASYALYLFLWGIMGRENVFKAIFMRIGLNFGVWGLLVYLHFYHTKTALPGTFVDRNPLNTLFKSAI